MPDEKQPEQPAAAAQPIAVNEQQMREAIAAGLEVLAGAEPAKVLQLVDKLPLCKLVMRAIAAGELAIVRPSAPPPPANRQQRRAAAAGAPRK